MKHRFQTSHRAPTVPATGLALALALLVAGCGGGEPAAPSATPAAPGGHRIEPGARHALPSTAVTATHDELVADVRAERHASDGGGRAWLEEGPTEVPVRRRARWTFLFEVGPEGIAAGGGVYFLVSPFWGWSLPHAGDPRRPGLVTAELADDPDDAGALGPLQIGGQLVLVPAARDLAPGERLRLVYGASDALAAADSYAELDAPFWFSVDGDGDGVRAQVADPPRIDVLPGPAARLELFLPGVARPGETVRATAAVLDRGGNTGVAFEGELLLAGDERWPVTPQRVAIPAEAGGVVDITFTLPADAPEGVLRLGAGAVRTDDEDGEPRGGRFLTLSNPMRVSADAPRVLWADLHGHTNLSDGTGTPEDFYDYAKRVARLDAVALTDHDHWGVQFLDQHPELWERIADAARAAHEPGVFTSLLAYEWTSWLHGHRHVVLFDEATPEGLPILSSVHEDHDDPDELWSALEGEPVLTFAHHSAGGPVATNWSFPPHPELEPVTEVASVHGSSEAWDSPGMIYAPRKGNFVRDALDVGYRLGFIGSGDGHDGHPGLAHLVSPSGGLAAIRAERNEPDALLAALRARDCYATNGERILVDADLGGFPMGAEVPATALAPDTALAVFVAGTDALDRIEVVRSGRVVRYLDAATLAGPDVAPGEAPPDFEAAFPLADLGLDDLEAGEYAYLRIQQARAGLAWTSPWFVR